jgi:hypothetical protein
MVDYTTHRYDEEWIWELLDLNDALTGELDGVTGGTLRRNLTGQIQTGGTMTWSGTDQPNWLRTRVRPIYRAKVFGGGVIEQICGTFIPAAPGTKWKGEHGSMSIELFDKTQILDEAKTQVTYGRPAGTVVTTVVRSLLESLGQTRLVVHESTATLAKDMVWKPGTKWLNIINDMLTSINYLPLFTDVLGVFRVEPHVPTSTRGIAYPFSDGPKAIYAPEFDFENDYFGLPNRLTLVSQGTGDDEGLTAVATLPASDPLSIESRGRPIDVTETGVEADSQATLNAMAVRRLDELTRRVHEVNFNHALVPLNLNDVVTFKRDPAGIDLRGLVQSMSISCTPGKLVSTVVQQVKY